MNAAEIKLDLFRRIDNLKESDLEKVYDKFVALLSTTSPYKLSKAEKAAVDEALDKSKNGQGCTREEVMKEARQKYPDLNFR
ncbi:MAG: hypothetical protein RQ746_08945 [Bacteroidales bacterium]|nr:hypothetical protein [Bacteroidales bacterium]